MCWLPRGAMQRSSGPAVATASVANVGVPSQTRSPARTVRTLAHPAWLRGCSRRLLAVALSLVGSDMAAEQRGLTVSASEPDSVG